VTGAQWDSSFGYVVDYLVGATDTSWVNFQYIESRNGLEDGVGLGNSHDLYVRNSRLHDNGFAPSGTDDSGSGISLYAAANVTVDSNAITGNSVGVWVTYGSQNLTISNNSMSASPKGAIGIGSHPEDPLYDPNVRISGIQILGNTITGNGYPSSASPWSGAAAIGIFNAWNGTISQNTISSNAGGGIYFEGDCSPPYFYGVCAWNSSWTVGLSYIQNNGGRGIEFEGYNWDMTVRWNVITHNGSSVGDQVYIGGSDNYINEDWSTNNDISY